MIFQGTQHLVELERCELCSKKIKWYRTENNRQIILKSGNGAGFMVKKAFDLGRVEYIGLKMEFIRVRLFYIRGNHITKGISIKGIAYW